MSNVSNAIQMFAIIALICVMYLQDREIEKQVARANKAEWILACIDSTKFDQDQCNALYIGKHAEK
jgi:hypothetical protein